MFKFFKNDLKIFSQYIKRMPTTPLTQIQIVGNKISNFSEKSSKEYMNRHFNDHYVKKANIVKTA
jgi:hypothetical protein